MRTATQTDVTVTRIAPRVLFAILLLAGCRTYGGYGSETATLEEMRELPGWAEAERGRLAGDLQAVAGRPELEGIERRLSVLDASLSVLAERWGVVVRTAGPDQTYRELRRRFGSLTAERQGWEDAYARLVYDAAAVLTGSPSGLRPRTRYQVSPVFFERLASDFDDVRIRDLVGSVR